MSFISLSDSNLLMCNWCTNQKGLVVVCGAVYHNSCC
ncbi:hypothetical protein T05_11611 [Trichinella murrelli]|uniref:Uncharacterized protein n=1 Tax=Trichinella murrelli TaxID=144512 RepID=A0A0V0SWQ9_9BILA|nr:hypothetical protein T05_11611 [Trichinella murrelli]